MLRGLSQRIQLRASAHAKRMTRAPAQLGAMARMSTTRSAPVAAQVALSGAQSPRDTNSESHTHVSPARVAALRPSDSAPRNECKLTQQQLMEIGRSEQCQQLMSELEAAVLALPEIARTSKRLARLTIDDGQGSSMQFGWYRPTKSASLKLRGNNQLPELAAVRAPLFELNALFGGFCSAVINVGATFAAHADPNDIGNSIGFTLGKFEGGQLVVDVPWRWQGAAKCSSLTQAPCICLSCVSDGKRVFGDANQGRALDVLRKPTLFESSKGHCTAPVTSGQRIFVCFYNRRDMPAECARTAMPPSGSKLVNGSLTSVNHVSMSSQASRCLGDEFISKDAFFSSKLKGARANKKFRQLTPARVVEDGWQPVLTLLASLDLTKPSGAFSVFQATALRCFGQIANLA